MTRDPAHAFLTTGRVRFEGVSRVVSLGFVPEVEVGDYVIVHAGCAIARVDESEARRVWRYLEEMEELAAAKNEFAPGGDSEGGDA